MNEVDLVPADYRRSLRVNRDITRFLLVFGGLLLLIFAASWWLGNRTAVARAEIQRLKTGEIVILEQQTKLEDLVSRQADYTARLEVLNLLRGGPPAEQLFVHLDRAINPSVWFTELLFVREGEVVETKSRGKNPGYFVVAPANHSRNQDQPWRNSTRIEIKGQSLNHSTLAKFVRTLQAQPGIDDVYLLNTSTRNYSSAEVINYQLAAVLDPVGKGE